jgi:undecaprenyl-diphosphatase
VSEHRGVPHWHFDPDHHGYLTPAGPVARRPLLAWALLGLVVAMAVVAAIDKGRLFDTWDEPIQRWVEARRSDGLEQFFRAVSRLGSNIVVFPLALVAATLAWFRCRPLAIAVVVAVAMRPLFEYVLKDAVGRPRPDLDRLVSGVGFSHPSGHVLATVTLYSLIPAVVALYLGRRRVWQATWVFVWLLAPAMAACRVYLGVHWTTDVVAGLLWGVVYLAFVGMIFDRYHADHCRHAVPRAADRRCAPAEAEPAGAAPAAGEPADAEPADVEPAGVAGVEQPEPALARTRFDAPPLAAPG